MKSEKKATTAKKAKTATKEISFFAFVALVAFVAFVADLHAESFSISMIPERSTGTLAEPLIIAVEARHPEGYALNLNLKDQKTGPFEVSGLELQSPGKAKLTVIAFDTGPLTFPSLEWTLQPGPGTAELKPQKIKSPPVRLEILGPELGPEADIKDIKPIWTLFPWSKLLAALALLGVLLYLLRKWRSRIGVPEILQSSGPRKTPDELALEKLKELVSSGIWEQGQHKLFYSRLCDVVREYLEVRYQIPCMNLTTFELFRQMREAEIERKICLMTKEFMEGCDLVKFARFVPSDPEKDKDVEAAESIILAATPKKEEPAAA